MCIIEFLQEEVTFGIDPDGPVVVDVDDGDEVVVPPVNCPLSSEHYQALTNSVDLLADLSAYAQDLYLAALQFVNSHVQQLTAIQLCSYSSLTFVMLDFFNE